MSRDCSYCGAASALRFRSRDFNRRLSRESFEHHRCPRCGLIFIAPVPDDLDRYYPTSYHSAPATMEVLEAGADRERYKIEIIRRFVGKGRLLEIGPSLGCFAHLARRSGFDVTAIEMDERCSAFLNDVAGIPTVNSDDVAAALATLEPFDVIAMWHVVEHLASPWKTLDAVAARLAPGGILVLAAPNPDAFQFRVLGRYWPHVDAPRHLTLIPSEVLVEKMTSLGMTLALSTTTDEGGLGWNVFGWEQAMANLGGPPPVQAVARMVGRVAARLAGPVEGVEGRGSAYTMVFRRGR